MLVRTCSYGGAGTPDRAHDVKVVETRGGETRQTLKLDESLFMACDESTLSRLIRGGTAEKDAARDKGKASGGEGAAAKPAAQKPIATAEALAEWDRRLRDRLQEELKDGRKPKFTLGLLQQECLFAALDDTGGMRIRSGGSEMNLAWKAMTLSDKKSLVMGMLREDRADDIAMAAFYHLSAGDIEKGNAFLARAGNAGEAVKAAFR
jgi:hypothetical protein